MSKRETYVKELQKYIRVDIYGKCGNLSICPHEQGILGPCVFNVAKKYKFYLAFENAYCQEYVTEKLHRTLMYPTVPIVMGGADYKVVAPPGKSYINVFDFKSPKHLADYLLYLDKHDVSEAKQL